MIHIGTAGWSLPRANQERFPGGGSHLERYASLFSAAEINSTFYRPHRASTFARWAESVPEDFKFSVKLAKSITHERRLADAGDLLDEFIGQLQPLGDKLACLLVQLPPSFAFDADVSRQFFISLRDRFERDVVLEPRHASWFGADADELLVMHRVARVAADPSSVPGATIPGGWPGLVYYRWHGSPRMYYSSYDSAALAALASSLNEARRSDRAAWCIFDNTASGAAISNALEVRDLLAATDDRD